MSDHVQRLLARAVAVLERAAVSTDDDDERALIQEVIEKLGRD